MSKFETNRKRAKGEMLETPSEPRLGFAVSVIQDLFRASSFEISRSVYREPGVRNANKLRAGDEAARDA
ncbi:MAG: hypothetical protein NTU88_10685 [Armatimonadetes bacterium]|nr:hypothetical protein [Armatimonadota bacterium]